MDRDLARSVGVEHRGSRRWLEYGCGYCDAAPTPLAIYSLAISGVPLSFLGSSRLDRGGSGRPRPREVPSTGQSAGFLASLAATVTACKGLPALVQGLVEPVSRHRQATYFSGRWLLRRQRHWAVPRDHDLMSGLPHSSQVTPMLDIPSVASVFQNPSCTGRIGRPRL